LGVRGFESAFELIGESVELNEAKYRGYDIKKQNRKGQHPLIVPSLEIVGANMKDIKRMIDAKIKKNPKLDIGEAAPANSVAGGNVDLSPHKKKRKNAKVKYEDFGGTRVYVVPNDRWHASRLGKNRYARYEKYIGNDKLGETIRLYGRENPKSPIILKNEENGAMLYLKYGGSKRKW